MRKKRDAEGTKSRVLKSAEKLFARKGFNGTSIADISKDSGISDGLILYHFKSKDKLYQEVIERVAARYMQVFEGFRENNLPPAEMMKESLREVFGFWRTDSTYNRISLWAYLERREATAVNEARLTAGLAAYLASLQESGHFPREIDPVVFLSTIIGPIHFWFRYKTRFAEILKLTEKDGALDDHFLKQFTLMLTSFFRDPNGPKKAV
ncbi:MAG: TetR/AcrR family transcriptional regulator [Spirochaetes bacterium]|nr:TetR/AcrR family transcriptional regulator [Spirochaetota bacterium]